MSASDRGGVQLFKSVMVEMVSAVASDRDLTADEEFEVAARLKAAIDAGLEPRQEVEARAHRANHMFIGSLKRHSVEAMFESGLPDDPSIDEAWKELEVSLSSVAARDYWKSTTYRSAFTQGATGLLTAEVGFLKSHGRGQEALNRLEYVLGLFEPFGGLPDPPLWLDVGILRSECGRPAAEVRSAFERAAADIYFDGMPSPIALKGADAEAQQLARGNLRKLEARQSSPRAPAKGGFLSVVLSALFFLLAKFFVLLGRVFKGIVSAWREGER